MLRAAHSYGCKCAMNLIFGLVMIVVLPFHISFFHSLSCLSLSLSFPVLCLCLLCSSFLFSSCLSSVSLSPCSCLHPSPLHAVLSSFLLHYLCLIHLPCVCVRSPTYKQCVTAAVTGWTLRLLCASSACTVLVEKTSLWCCPSYRVASVPAVRVRTVQAQCDHTNTETWLKPVLLKVGCRDL